MKFARNDYGLFQIRFMYWRNFRFFFIEVLLCELKMKEMLKFFYTVSDDYENI